MDSSYKGASETKSGKGTSGTKSHYELKGHELGGIKGSRKGIKNSYAGRHLHETEHHGRMGHEISTDNFPSHEGDGATV